MNFIRKINRGNIYFSNRNFQIWWLIRGMEVMKKYQISHGTCGVNNKTVLKDASGRYFTCQSVNHKKDRPSERDCSTDLIWNPRPWNLQ